MKNYAAEIGFLIALLAFANGDIAFAADVWPSKPVVIVVPFAPGGSTDLTARTLATRLRTELGQSVIVENRSGAAGNIGSQYVANSKPDGYTVFLATSTNITNMSLYKSAPDMVRDLVPVSQVAFIPNVLVIHPSVPPNNLVEFVKFIKGPKNTLNYASAGPGSSLHLASVLFDKMVGVHMMQVHYRGSAPAIVDLMGGHVDASFPPFVDALPHIKSKRLKALGLTTKKRSPIMPELPAIGEVLPGYEVALWNGIFAPAKTPPDVLQKLNASIATIVHQPDMTALFAEQGSEIVGSSLTDFGDFTRREVQKWRALVKLSGAKVE